MRLCAVGGGTVSDDLRDVLRAAVAVSEASDGAFDVTVGPLVALWRAARATGRLPDAAALEAARAKVGWRKLEVRGNHVELAPGMRLDLGGIGKGYAADAALATLRARGVERALVDIGGDLALGEGPWTVRVAGEPRELERCGVAASGDTERFVEVDGVRYSHLLDPRTGLGLTHGIEVTVIAPTATEADAWASAASVLGRAPVKRPGYDYTFQR
jgi:thiamine biosynthesis lipoprotein